MSSEANGLDVDLEAAVRREYIGDVGIPAGTELLAYTNAVEAGDGDLEAARRALEAAIGEEATLQAAATIAIFNGLVRVADGTGIRLDDGLFVASVEDRKLLEIDRFAGAANSTDLHPAARPPARQVSEIFG